MSQIKIEAVVRKNTEVRATIEGAITTIEQRAGKEGFRLSYDKANHIIASLRQAGFTIVRRRRTPLN